MIIVTGEETCLELSVSKIDYCIQSKERGEWGSRRKAEVVSI